MRKISLLILIVVVFVTVYFAQKISDGKSQETNSQEFRSTLKTKENITGIKESKQAESFKEVIFIPYWNIPIKEKVKNYDELLYFGIAPDINGQVMFDEGYSGLKKFADKEYKNQKKTLVIRMLNTNINNKILENEEYQNAFINASLNISKEYSFQNLAVDLEFSGLPFANVKTAISEFMTEFSRLAKKEGYGFKVIIYGDLFYRGRPYDLSIISSRSDEILVMAYDFNKPRGEPGPNFPLSGGQKYSYDFKKMTQDFLRFVPADKLTIIFGMYGYDWTLGPQGLPLKIANAIPLHEIESKIIASCLNSCEVVTDPNSFEKSVKYIDEAGYRHILWYEDFESVAKKKEFLKEQGIGHYGYWVWGYF